MRHEETDYRMPIRDSDNGCELWEVAINLESAGRSFPQDLSVPLAPVPPSKLRAL